MVRPKSTLVSFVYPAQNPQLMKLFEQRQLTVLALDAVPRTLSRSQAYDTLSSQANVAGYRAVVEASHAFGRMVRWRFAARLRFCLLTALSIHSTRRR
jgi:NAD(P) transhydrogenase subunit alpha